VCCCALNKFKAPYFVGDKVNSKRVTGTYTETHDVKGTHTPVVTPVDCTPLVCTLGEGVESSARVRPPFFMTRKEKKAWKADNPEVQKKVSFKEDEKCEFRDSKKKAKDWASGSTRSSKKTTVSSSTGAKIKLTKISASYPHGPMRQFGRLLQKIQNGEEEKVWNGPRDVFRSLVRDYCDGRLGIAPLGLSKAQKLDVAKGRLRDMTPNRRLNLALKACLIQRHIFLGPGAVLIYTGDTPLERWEVERPLFIQRSQRYQMDACQRLIRLQGGLELVHQAEVDLTPEELVKTNCFMKRLGWHSWIECVQQAEASPLRRVVLLRIWQWMKAVRETRHKIRGNRSGEARHKHWVDCGSKKGFGGAKQPKRPEFINVRMEERYVEERPHDNVLDDTSINGSHGTRKGPCHVVSASSLGLYPAPNPEFCHDAEDYAAAVRMLENAEHLNALVWYNGLLYIDLNVLQVVFAPRETQLGSANGEITGLDDMPPKAKPTSGSCKAKDKRPSAKQELNQAYAKLAQAKAKMADEKKALRAAQALKAYEEDVPDYDDGLRAVLKRNEAEHRQSRREMKLETQERCRAARVDADGDALPVGPGAGRSALVSQRGDDIPRAGDGALVSSDTGCVIPSIMPSGVELCLLNGRPGQEASRNGSPARVRPVQSQNSGVKEVCVRFHDGHSMNLGEGQVEAVMRRMRVRCDDPLPRACSPALRYSDLQAEYRMLASALPRGHFPQPNSLIPECDDGTLSEPVRYKLPGACGSVPPPKLVGVSSPAHVPSMPAPIAVAPVVSAPAIAPPPVVVVPLPSAPVAPIGAPVVPPVVAPALPPPLPPPVRQPVDKLNNALLADNLSIGGVRLPELQWWVTRGPDPSRDHIPLRCMPAGARHFARTGEVQGKYAFDEERSSLFNSKFWAKAALGCCVGSTLAVATVGAAAAFFYTGSAMMAAEAINRRERECPVGGENSFVDPDDPVERTYAEIAQCYRGYYVHRVTMKPDAGPPLAPDAVVTDVRIAAVRNIAMLTVPSMGEFKYQVLHVPDAKFMFPSFWSFQRSASPRLCHNETFVTDVRKATESFVPFSGDVAQSTKLSLLRAAKNTSHINTPEGNQHDTTMTHILHCAMLSGLHERSALVPLNGQPRGNDPNSYVVTSTGTTHN